MISTKNALFYLMTVLFVAALSGGIALLVVQGKDGGPGLEILLPTPTPARAESARQRRRSPAGRIHHG